MKSFYYVLNKVLPLPNPLNSQNFVVFSHRNMTYQVKTTTILGLNESIRCNTKLWHEAIFQCIPLEIQIYKRSHLMCGYSVLDPVIMLLSRYITCSIVTILLSECPSLDL